MYIVCYPQYDRAPHLLTVRDHIQATLQIRKFYPMKSLTLRLWNEYKKTMMKYLLGSAGSTNGKIYGKIPADTSDNIIAFDGLGQIIECCYIHLSSS